MLKTIGEGSFCTSYVPEWIKRDLVGREYCLEVGVWNGFSLLASLLCQPRALTLWLRPL